MATKIWLSSGKTRLLKPLKPGKDWGEGTKVEAVKLQHDADTLVRQFVSKPDPFPPKKHGLNLLSVSFPAGIHFRKDDWLEVEFGMDFVTFRVKRGLGQKRKKGK